MGFWAIVTTVAKFLPELLSLIKTLHSGAKAGITEVVLKKRLKTIEKAFSHTDRRRAARELNDVFKN